MMTGEHSAPPARQLFTVGHSNHGEQEFVGLLRQHRIDVVADVRSHPYVNFATHFNAAPIQVLLAGADIHYLFLGKELGGRPADPEYYDAEGYVRYDRLAASPWFQHGIERLEAGLDRYRVAVTRAFRSRPGEPPLHWLQVNNIHFAHEPSWRLG